MASGGNNRGRLTRFFQCLVRIDKPFLTIEPVDALVVRPPAFPAQQHMESPIAVLDSHGCQLPQSLA